MALFESYERRIAKINAVLAQVRHRHLEEAKQICDAKGIDRRRHREGHPAHRF